MGVLHAKVHRKVEGFIVSLILLKGCLLKFKGSCLQNCLKASEVKVRLKILETEGKG